MRFLLVFAMAPAVAEADHQHGMVTGSAEASSSFAVGLSLVAAEFETMEYGGEYQGLVPAVRWTHGRFAVAGNLGVYHLTKNGLARYGAGDAVVHGQASLLERGSATVGVALAVSAPTGDQLDGLGMGHPMLMPAAYARWATAGGSVDASLGFGQALGGEHGHDSHGGAWPLVEPMNRSEVTFTASGELVLAKQLRAGGRFSGAVPTGVGVTRVVGGVRVLWTAGRVDTAFEVQAGIAGDPFQLRGVLETALRF